MTYDDVVRIALALPGVEESYAWGTPALKRKGRFMLRLKEDGEAVAAKLDWDSRDRLLAERPDVFFLTPHYEGYPAVLVRLAELDERLAKELLDASWENAPLAAKTRR